MFSKIKRDREREFTSKESLSCSLSVLFELLSCASSSNCWVRRVYQFELSRFKSIGSSTATVVRVGWQPFDDGERSLEEA